MPFVVVLDPVVVAVHVAEVADVRVGQSEIEGHAVQRLVCQPRWSVVLDVQLAVGVRLREHVALCVDVRKVDGVDAHKGGGPDGEEGERRHGQLVAADLGEVDDILGGAEDLLGADFPEALGLVAGREGGLVQRPDRTVAENGDKGDVFAVEHNLAHGAEHVERHVDAAGLVVLVLVIVAVGPLEVVREVSVEGVQLGTQLIEGGFGRPRREVFGEAAARKAPPRYLAPEVDEADEAAEHAIRNPATGIDARNGFQKTRVDLL